MLFKSICKFRYVSGLFSLENKNGDNEKVAPNRIELC